jgi:hypothetical protein
MRGIPNPSRCQPRRLSAFLSAFCETGDRQKSESNLAAFAESNRIWVYLASERPILQGLLQSRLMNVSLDCSSVSNLPRCPVSFFSTPIVFSRIYRDSPS